MKRRGSLINDPSHVRKGTVGGRGLVASDDSMSFTGRSAYRHRGPAVRRKRESWEWIRRSDELPRHEDITVCVIDPAAGGYTFIEGARDTFASMNRIVSGGHYSSAKHLHAMSVTVGARADMQRTYGLLYRWTQADADNATEYDETVVFRTTDVNGNDIFHGLPLGKVVLFNYDNRRTKEETRPGTLTEEDKEFLRHHIFAKDGRVFLMAEARKEY